MEGCAFTQSGGLSDLSILQKYVLRELLGPLGLGLLVFTFVFLIGHLFKLVDLLLNAGVRGQLVAELILTLLPSILSFTIPMALLVATLLGIGRLAADREILAIRMGGVNLMHICVPVIAFAGILAGLMMWANQRLVPYLTLKSTDLAMQIWFETLSSLPPNRFKELPSGDKWSVFFFEYRDAQTGAMHNVNIKTDIEQEENPQVAARRQQARQNYDKLIKKGDPESLKQAQYLKEKVRLLDSERGSQETLIVAQTGRIRADLSQRVISLDLTSGSMHIFDPKRPTAYNILSFETWSKGLKPKSQRNEVGSFRKNPTEMTVGELREGMSKVSGRRRGQMLATYWQRFSIPLACLAFVLVAIPLAVYVRPTGKAIAFAIAFLLILAYYGLLEYGASLGVAHPAAAPYAIFFPNILLSVVGSFLLYRMVMK